MKLTFILILSLIAANAIASPFLVCTPVAAGTSSTPASYTVTGLGGAITSPAVTISAGTVQLHLDLSAIPNGTYTVTATATNSAGTSAASGPFTFSLPLPSMPASPAGLSLSPN